MMTKLKLLILRALLRWFHEEYFPAGGARRYTEAWRAIDTVRGLVYQHIRDRWRREKKEFGIKLPPDATAKASIEWQKP